MERNYQSKAVAKRQGVPAHLLEGIPENRPIKVIDNATVEVSDGAADNGAVRQDEAPLEHRVPESAKR